MNIKIMTKDGGAIETTMRISLNELANFLAEDANVIIFENLAIVREQIVYISVMP